MKASCVTSSAFPRSPRIKNTVRSTMGNSARKNQAYSRSVSATCAPHPGTAREHRALYPHSPDRSSG